MGRHSARDDDDDVTSVVAVDVAVAEAAGDPAPHGRHAQSAQESDEQRTDVIVIDPALVASEEPGTEVLPAIDDGGDGGLPALLADLPGAVETPTEESAPSWAQRRAAKRAAKAARKQHEAGAPTAPIPVLPPEPGADSGAADRKPARKESDTHADLRLLRKNSAVRAQCLAAVVVSFALYSVVLLVISKTDVYLLWIWIPIVLAGVLVGAVLDAAHKRERRVVDSAEPPPSG